REPAADQGSAPHCCVAANRKWRTLQEAASLRSRLCIAARRPENLRELRRFCGAVINCCEAANRNRERCKRLLPYGRSSVLPRAAPKIFGSCEDSVVQ